MLDRVRISGPWQGGGVGGSSNAAGPSLTIRDSILRSGALGDVIDVDDDVTIARSELRVGDPSRFGVNFSPNPGSGSVGLFVDSSVILGGIDAVRVEAPNNTQLKVFLRQSTLDAGTLGTSDAANRAVTAITTGSGTVAVTITDSIALEEQLTQQLGSAAPSIACASSDVPNQLTPTVACGSAPGNPAGNSSSTAAQLFVGGAPSFSYQLNGASPALDSGSTLPLGLPESTTDRLGKPRVVDGNFDCVARRDKGAFELQSQANTDCTAAGTSPISEAAGGTNAISGADETSAIGTTAPPPPPAVGGQPLAVAGGPAVISKVSVSNRRFAPMTANRSRLATRKRAPRGTRVRYTLSEPAQVTITVHRALSGRRSGKQCVKATKRNRPAPRCTRYVRAGAIVVAKAKQGPNSQSFSGRFGRRAPLCPCPAADPDTATRSG